MMILFCLIVDYMILKTDPTTNAKAISLNEYKSNLDSIYRIVKKLNKKLFWITTTPVNDSIHNSKQVGFYRYNRDVEIYNAVADSLFTQYNVPIIDLYSFTRSFPKEAYSDHIHFKPEYAKLQAKFISEFLMKNPF